MNQKLKTLLSNLYSVIESPVIIIDGSNEIIFLNPHAQKIWSVTTDKKILFSEVFQKINKKDLERSIRQAKQKEGFIVHYGPLAAPNNIRYDMNFAKTTLENTDLVVITLRESSSNKIKDMFDYASISAIENIDNLEDLGQLAATIAHEINTPLTIILAATSQLEKPFDETRDLPKVTNLIRRSTHKISRIISRLNRVSQKKHLQLTEVNAFEIIREALQMCERTLIENQINIDVVCKDLKLIQCDPLQVEQILINLLNNACHALKKKSAKKQIKITLDTSEGFTTIEVWNNGLPIPNDLQENTLIPLLSSNYNDNHTGLGLAISNKIMQEHNGNLSYYSDTEKGTGFTLKFPKIDKNLFNTDLSGLKVMVVDEDDAFREFLISQLKSSNADVVEAKNGTEAEDYILNNSRVDAVLTDITVSCRSGQELTKILRKLDQGPSVFAMRGFDNKLGFHNHPDISHECFEKPFDFQNIFTALEKSAMYKKSTF